MKKDQRNKPDEPETPTEPGKEETRNLDDLVSVVEAAKILKLMRSTLDHYRCEGRGPVYRKHGGRVFYKKADLIAWSERNTFRSTSQRIGKSK
ncbi:MAG: hypothetical protein B7X53_00045 [Hyphomonas sp. 34-62-18]|nr:MAG: hypothetical protein B7X53_00045 [Hyphomonas sp. 34-62-18]